MSMTTEKIVKRERRFYPEDVDFTNWNNVKESLEKLLDYEIKDADDLILYLEMVSELQMIISEEMGKRYIKMTCYADNKDYQKDYNDFYDEIISASRQYFHKLSVKYYQSTHRNQLSKKKYNHLDMIIGNSIELFREENIAISAKEMKLKNKYGEIISSLSAMYDGKEQTMAQLGKYLQEPDRKVREEVWKIRYDTILKHKDHLYQLFDDLKELRIEEAKNAGYDNYRDYKHQEMGRFAYTPEDVHIFHIAVEENVIPFLKEVNAERKDKLGVESVRPWDTAVDLDGKVLKPFANVDEFINKAITILEQIDHDFALNLCKMRNTDLLDLENRKGKAPGGYNYPLRELGSSFIFMNSVGLHRDVVTLLHESGHAMHSIATRNINLIDYKEAPSEVAELASMAMELLTMDYWTEYYSDRSDFIKAKKDQLLGTLKFLPWCMIVDAFQQWIYTNPAHTPTERANYFGQLVERFNPGVDWNGLTEQQQNGWLFQLHIFEVPFYYIEYGMAQLGALSIYMNYKQKGKKAIDDYKDFLALGYSKSIPELYQAAGIEFDFSSSQLKKLVDFVKCELAELD